MLVFLSITLTLVFGLGIHYFLQKRREKFMLERLPLAAKEQLIEAGLGDSRLNEATELFNYIEKAFGLSSGFLRLTDTLKILSDSDSIMGNSEGITEIEVLIKKSGAKNLSVSSTVLHVIEAVLVVKNDK